MHEIFYTETMIREISISWKSTIPVRIGQQGLGSVACKSVINLVKSPTFGWRTAEVQ